MLHCVHSEAVYVGLLDPVAVSLDEDVSQRRSVGVVIAVVVLERADVAVLILRVLIPAVPRDLASTVIEILVLQLGRDPPIWPTPEAKREAADR